MRAARRAKLSVMFALIAAAAAAAQAAPVGLSGIWEGTVGNLPVRACFAQREWGPFGAYYYMSQRRLIPLEPVEGAPSAFSEGSTDRGNPRWQVEAAAGDRLRARWTNGRRTLVVQLRRLTARIGEEGPCGSMAFHQPRLDAVRTVTRRAAVDGRSYTRISLDHGGRFEANVTTFALDGGGEAVRRINAALGRSLSGNPPEWLECVLTPLERSSIEGGIDETIEPVMVSRRWLSVSRQSDSFCGGAHPNSGRYYDTYDLASGAQVDLHDWFGDRAVRRERVEGSEDELKTLTPALREVVLAGWSTDAEECTEVVRDAEYWNIGLRRDAFIFAPSLPHVVQACGDEFAVPFARVRPFLTREGAANVEALRPQAAPAAGGARS